MREHFTQQDVERFVQASRLDEDTVRFISEMNAHAIDCLQCRTMLEEYLEDCEYYELEEIFGEVTNPIVIGDEQQEQQ